MALGGAKTSTKMATDELIDDTLEMYEAKKRGLKVPDAQVDSAFASIAQRLKLSPAQFSQALTSHGVEAVTLKQRLRAQIDLADARPAAHAVEGDGDLAGCRQRDARQEQRQPRTRRRSTNTCCSRSSSSCPRARRSPFTPSAGARPKRSGSASRAATAAWRRQEQLRGVVVKDIGRRDDTQLNGSEGDDIKKTPVGKTAAPYQMDEGIELVAVCSVRQVQSTAGVRAEVTNDLYLKQSKDLGKDYLDELRKAAIIEYR